MALTSKLTAIADAIREKTGSENTMTLDEMAENINRIESEDTDLLTSIIDRSITEYAADTVTSIGAYAFAGCTNLTMVTLTGSSCTNIGAYAFYGCENLAALFIDCETLITLENSNALTGTPIADGSGYIYIAARDINIDYIAYQSAYNWSDYADRIVDAGEYAPSIDVDLLV